MKTPKSKAKPAKAPDADAAAEKVPEATPSQLAMIAATLAGNSALGTPDSLVATAMEIFEAARAQVIKNQAQGFLEKTLDEEFGFSWVSQDYPLNREEFLATMLPNYASRPTDLARIGKAFVRHRLRSKNGKEPTLDEVAAAYANWGTYQNPNVANRNALDFRVWWKEDHIKEVRSDAGKKSAAKKNAGKEVEAAAKKKVEKKL